MKKILFVILILLLQACASGPPKSKFKALTGKSISMLHQQPLKLEVLPTPKFHQLTGADQATMAAGILFGAVGGGAAFLIAKANAEKRGQALLTEHNIQDPTTTLVERVQDLLESKYGSTMGETGTVIRVGTENWAISKDDVHYFSVVQIMDPSGKKAIAQGKCRYSNQKSPDKPGLDALLADNAQKLKEELNKGVLHCIEEFDKSLFVAIP